MKKRAIILLMDSLGIGHSDDAHKFDDLGSNTLGNIIKHHPDIKIPNLTKLGLLNCLSKSSQDFKDYKLHETNSLWGYAQEKSLGKDTITGHWELMGCYLDFDWGYFLEQENSFPQELLNKIFEKSGIKSSLGNCNGSGTEILNKYGEEHIKTGIPIFYTSDDSVFQIIGHEEHFGLEKLYKLCEIAREELYSMNIGRVIARPFIGENPSNFKRTGNRKDYAIAPHKPTLFTVAKKSSYKVIAIGKTADIFAHKDIDITTKATGLENLFNATLKELENHDQGVFFTNFVDFDSEYGHRRDVKGYKEAIEYFDSRLPEILKVLKPDDLLVITADHGNDPTFKGFNHTREHIPIIFTGENIKSGYIGKRDSFEDVGASIAEYLGITLPAGKSFYQ